MSPEDKKRIAKDADAVAKTYVGNDYIHPIDIYRLYESGAKAEHERRESEVAELKAEIAKLNAKCEEAYDDGYFNGSCNASH